MLAYSKTGPNMISYIYKLSLMGAIFNEMTKGCNMNFFISLAIAAVLLFANKPPAATVATVGGMDISQDELAFHIFGISQQMPEGGLTKDIIVQAIGRASEYKVIESVAKEKGYALTNEERSTIKQTLRSVDQAAVSNNQIYNARKTGDDYLRENTGVGKNRYKKLMEVSLIGGRMLEDLYGETEVADDEALARYEADIEMFNVASVRHILFTYEGAPGGEESGRAKEESEKLAHETVSRVKAGEDMARLVHELSDDPYLEEDGVYTFGPTDGYDPGFLGWTFAEGRKAGDVGVCESVYGYHVMRLEEFGALPFEEVKPYIVDTMKYDIVNNIIAEWKNEPRFALQIDEDAVASMIGSDS